MSDVDQALAQARRMADAVCPPGPYRNELARKFIHVGTGILPLAYAFLNHRWIATGIMAALCLGCVVLEIVRRRDCAPSRLFGYCFGLLLREHEKGGKLMGSTYYCFASLFCIALFPRPIAVLALLYLAVGDTAASLIGMKFGRIKIGRKSLEGTLAFWISCSLVALIARALSPDYPLLPGLIAAPVAALAELLLPDWDDNMVIPVVSAVTMWLVIFAL